MGQAARLTACRSGGERRPRPGRDGLVQVRARREKERQNRARPGGEKGRGSPIGRKGKKELAGRGSRRIEGPKLA
ncbi:hypothetical protein E2562_018768 [Oryza meyeriana var. granulata]|uniref:Uncharacterized protein n=1 Tax=Oryza meyeriana var. granulata TaxID=110450 RepID=A0A6G1EX82_9ORYZ|nr:hypothetical protein E2562_018768 [Oryza meyeriana var. granulata]